MDVSDANSAGADARPGEGGSGDAGGGSVGGDVSGGAICTGSGARIRCEQAGHVRTDDTARLPAAIRELRATLARHEGQTPGLEGELADAEDEIARTGDLGSARLGRLRERLELTALTAAGGSSLAAPAAQVSQLLA
ncbi:hypothetical protein ACFWZ2_27865 [Streptomyces sp. NPDC059002]|uniref:hypothetical protein n=1 Tax=Streptomyces sp. NPDC059002 TaxID=3346690 RepID=UPI00368E7DAB